MVLVGADELPLSHRRIMFTSPRQYAQKLAARLTERGARPVWVPSIEITRLQSAQAVQVRNLYSPTSCKVSVDRLPLGWLYCCHDHDWLVLHSHFDKV
jgi:hypothetical protein